MSGALLQTSHILLNFIMHITWSQCSHIQNLQGILAAEKKKLIVSTSQHLFNTTARI